MNCEINDFVIRGVPKIFFRVSWVRHFCPRISNFCWITLRPSEYLHLPQDPPKITYYRHYSILLYHILKASRFFINNSVNFHDLTQYKYILFEFVKSWLLKFFDMWLFQCAPLPTLSHPTFCCFFTFQKNSIGIYKRYR